MHRRELSARIEMRIAEDRMALADSAYEPPSSCHGSELALKHEIAVALDGSVCCEPADMPISAS